MDRMICLVWNEGALLIRTTFPSTSYVLYEVCCFYCFFHSAIKRCLLFLLVLWMTFFCFHSCYLFDDPRFWFVVVYIMSWRFALMFSLNLWRHCVGMCFAKNVWTIGLRLNLRAQRVSQINDPRHTMDVHFFNVTLLTFCHLVNQNLKACLHKI